MADTTAPPAPGKGGGGLLAAFKRKPALALGAAGAAALGAFLLLGKGKSNAAADAGTSAQPGTIDPSVYGTPSDLAGQQDYLGNTDALQIENQLTSLQGQLAQIAANTMPKQPGGKPPPRRPPPRRPPPRRPPPRRPRRHRGVR